MMQAERSTVPPAALRLPGGGRPAFDLTGTPFGQLTVLRLAERDPHQQGRCWVCRCTCGRTATVRAKDLKNGNTRSCGCLTNRPLVSAGGLTERQRTILQTLSRHAGGVRPGVFVPILGTSASSVSKSNGRLIAKGHIQKTGCVLRITAEGVTVLRNLAAAAPPAAGLLKEARHAAAA